MNIIFAALLYAALFITVELAAKKYPFSGGFWRKVVHILAGLFSAALVFEMSFAQIVFLGVFFSAAMLFSKKINLFSSIHQVKRPTYGEVFFPLSIAIVALIFPVKILYLYGVLVLSISDGLAGLVGQRFGKKTYRISSKKSYAGSFAFFISAVLIGLALLPLFGLVFLKSFIASLVLAALLTIAEGALPLGLDNLILPPLAALLLSCALRNF
jgi:phytol kinase